MDSGERESSRREEGEGVEAGERESVFPKSATDGPENRFDVAD